MNVRSIGLAFLTATLVACGDSQGAGGQTDGGVDGVATTPQDTGAIPSDHVTADARDGAANVDTGTDGALVDTIDTATDADAGDAIDVDSATDSNTDPLDADTGATAPDVLDAATLDAVVTLDAEAGTSGPECVTSPECATSFGGAVCDIPRGICVTCTTAEDTCATGSYCESNRCATGCGDDADCTAGTHCDGTSHRCVGCVDDAQCAPGTVCTAATCQRGCNAGHGCGVGDSCCNGVCVNLDLTASSCGACGHSCASGQACCNGACAFRASDPTNCGACGNTCMLHDATATCRAGSCSIAACTPGYADCDLRADDGCESLIASDPANCGGCQRACPSGPNSRATCTLGTCDVVCLAGFADCNGNPADGCEVTLAQDVDHCGTCSHACVGAPSATATCSMGTCGIQCTGTHADCNGNAADGCETDRATSADNCGACGAACSIPNGFAACSAGTCGLAACMPGRGDCNLIATDGCERDITTDNANCGTCGHACTGGSVCSGGNCVAQCASGLTMCGAACVDTTASIASCGACGMACPVPAHATPTCAARTCGFSCAMGFADCNGLANDGCEVELATSLANCGACGNACTGANGTPSCASGRCGLACGTGFADCNLDLRDGCEVDLRTTTTSCGACNTACAFPNAVANCATSTCGIASCQANFGNCNGTVADGCEADLRVSGANCGACGHVCGAGTACSAGMCASTCGAGLTYCPAVATCVNLQSDAANCGACARACATGQSCVAGGCITPPPANDRCTAPIDLAFTSGRRVTVAGTTAGANRELSAACAPSGVVGDVFYRFTITQPEMVYADTFGSNRDTVLYFANDCNTPSVTRVANDIVCNDDAASIGCTADGVQSQIVSRFAAGTYYIVVGSKTGTAGAFNLRVDHLPAGAGDVAPIPPGNTNLDGSVGHTSGFSGSCGGTRSGEDTYWWRTCSSSASGSYSFNTCNFQTNFHTDTYLLSALNSAEDKCSDDSGFWCMIRGSIDGTAGAGAGLRVVIVDGDNGETGNYRITSTRP